MIAIGLLALTGTSASANPFGEEMAIKVSYSGLDINTEAGAKVLLNRIEQAAGEICGPEPSNRLDRIQTFRPFTRRNRSKPSWSSACLSTLLTDGWDTFSARAAVEIDPCAYTAWKTSICLRRMA